MVRTAAVTLAGMPTLLARDGYRCAPVPAARSFQHDVHVFTRLHKPPFLYLSDCEEILTPVL